MNFKEGMRRLALLVGALGATLGCFASYVVLRDATAEWRRYKAFELLATSNVVQQERISWVLAKLPQGYTPASSEVSKDMTPEQAIEKLRALPEAKQRELLARLAPEAKKGILEILNKQKDIVTTWKSLSPERREELLAKMTPEQKHRLRTVIEQQTQQREQDPYAAIAEPIDEPPGWEVVPENTPNSSQANKEGIKTIHWDQGSRS